MGHQGLSPPSLSFPTAKWSTWLGRRDSCRRLAKSSAHPSVRVACACVRADVCVFIGVFIGVSPTVR